jgi:hypothetical protein
MVTDRLMAAAVVALVFGSAVCFGGAVWWFRPALAIATLILVTSQLAQYLVRGRLPLFKSPLALLGFGALGLGIVQLLPLPPTAADWLSPTAREIYAYGGLPGLAKTDLPTIQLSEPAQVRSPATLDRAATLRWLVGACACLGVFWGVTHFADRLERLYLVWGSIVAAFVLNAALAMVQLAGHSDGLFGFIQPGRAPIWAPSTDDMLESPSMVVMRRLGSPSVSGEPSAPIEPTVLIPEPPFLFGTMMGGAGAFLGLSALALPLALAIVLQVTAPRGSRESLAFRLQHTGQGGLAVLLVAMLITGTFLVGMMAGPWFCAPFALGLLIVGLPGVAGARWLSIGLTSVLLGSLGLGATFAGLWPEISGGRAPITALSTELAGQLWAEGSATLRDFPLVGTGLGSFPTIHPYMKTHDASSTTAMSTVLQWAVEAGGAGLALCTVAVIWSVSRLPGSVKRVGVSDRPLAYGLIGAAMGFSLWAVVHWTVELPAIAVSASALGGTWNRWLTGGTDLFVERG